VAAERQEVSDDLPGRNRGKRQHLADAVAFVARAVPGGPVRVRQRPSDGLVPEAGRVAMMAIGVPPRSLRVYPSITFPTEREP
jgi:hypothetical protein